MSRSHLFMNWGKTHLQRHQQWLACHFLCQTSTISTPQASTWWDMKRDKTKKNRIIGQCMKKHWGLSLAYLISSSFYHKIFYSVWLCYKKTRKDKNKSKSFYQILLSITLTLERPMWSSWFIEWYFFSIVKLDWKFQFKPFFQIERFFSFLFWVVKTTAPPGVFETQYRVCLKY